MNLSNGDLKQNTAPGQVQIDQTTKGFYSSVQIVSTAAETVSFGDVSNPRLIFLQNLSSTNFVLFGPTVSGSSTGALATANKLFPGDYAVFPGSTAASYKAQADTAAVRLVVQAFEA